MLQERQELIMLIRINVRGLRQNLVRQNLLQHRELQIQIKSLLIQVVEFNANRSARPGFVKGNRPAIVAKVEPTEEEVKNQIRETLEKLQGKGGKSKAAKYRREKERRIVRKQMMNKEH